MGRGRFDRGGVRCRVVVGEAVNVFERMIARHLWKKGVGMFSGYKTYVAGAGLILLGLSQIATALATGDDLPQDAFTNIGTGLGLVGLRSAVTK
jgi:hypothetical protein